MNARLAIASVVVISLWANAEKPNELQEAIDALRVGVKETLGQLVALDAVDQKLAASVKAQVETLVALKRLEAKLLRDDVPSLRDRKAQLNSRIDRYVAGGCPKEDAIIPQALVERCTPEQQSIMAARQLIVTDQQALQDQQTKIAKTRQAVSDTTLANTIAQKQNITTRETLQSTSSEQAGRLRKLYAKRITNAVAKVESREKASKACQATAELEKAACCHDVVWSGRSPSQCDAVFIYELLETGGVFSNSQ